MPMPKDSLLARGVQLPQIDLVTAQVVAGALENIGLEMGHKLARMSYSSIIRESEDFGAALLDSLCRQLCECPISTPLQLGPIPGYMRGVVREMAEDGDEFFTGHGHMHNHAESGRP